jgi:hypothetical protein
MSRQPLTLLTLPPEIRLSIYHHLFLGTRRVYVLNMEIIPRRFDLSVLAILRVCHQTYSEAKDLYHSRSPVAVFDEMFYFDQPFLRLPKLVIDRVTVIESYYQEVRDLAGHLIMNPESFGALQTVRLLGCPEISFETVATHNETPGNAGEAEKVVKSIKEQKGSNIVPLAHLQKLILARPTMVVRGHVGCVIRQAKVLQRIKHYIRKD